MEFCQRLLVSGADLGDLSIAICDEIRAGDSSFEVRQIGEGGFGNVSHRFVSEKGLVAGNQNIGEGVMCKFDCSAVPAVNGCATLDSANNCKSAKSQVVEI